MESSTYSDHIAGLSSPRDGLLILHEVHGLHFIGQVIGRIGVHPILRRLVVVVVLIGQRITAHAYQSRPLFVSRRPLSVRSGSALRWSRIHFTASNGSGNGTLDTVSRYLATNHHFPCHAFSVRIAIPIVGP